MNPLETIIRHIETAGPIAAVRVSSAHARGAARRYSYWGVARYEISLDASGNPCARCKRAAPSARRSIRLAGMDAQETGLPVIRSIGGLCAADIDTVANYLETLTGATA